MAEPPEELLADLIGDKVSGNLVDLKCLMWSLHAVVVGRHVGLVQFSARLVTTGGTLSVLE